jgi:hypothetical protein
MEKYDEIQVTDNFGNEEFIRLPSIDADHGGGDILMKDKIFKYPSIPDPFKQAANVRDGAMAVLIGIAARNSIDAGKPVRIIDLIDLKPQEKKPD